MPDAGSSMAFARRIGGWLRAIRGVASTRRLVEAQDAEQHELRRALDDLGRLHGDLFRENASRLDSSAAQLGALQQSLQSVGARQREMAEALDTSSATLESLRDSQRELGASLGEIRVAQADLRHAQAELAARQEKFAAELARHAPPIPPLPRAGDGDSAAWFYAAFEETFRGTREEIRERLSPYVADVRAAHAATGGPAVDLGCGRGEWLELMREAAIAAQGVDENALVVDRCRQLGLDVVHGDAVAYLASLPERTLSAVTAFHLVEHLALSWHLQLLVAAHRALAPNGLLVLETPNPENLVVGAWTFRMDPSHLHSLPPSLVRFLLEAVGFEVVEIRRLNPDDRLAERALRERWPTGIRELLCGPRDFGVIARRREA